MANINDYIKWRGDIDLDVSPLNEVDIMILSRFSYLPFQMVKHNEEETIASIAKKFKNFDVKELNMPGDKALSLNIVNAKRFANIKVTDFRLNTDMEAEKQFAAITMHLPSGELFISYCGTDNTLVGWKEDFNLSFMMHIPAQLEAVEYLKNIAKKYPKKKIYLAGHSKGGNVAVYAAVFAPKMIQKRIKMVVNHDGPGFDKKIINSDEYKAVLDKIYTYIPQSSVIGMLLEHEEKYKDVKSVEKGIMQHDIYSWQVLGTKIIQLKELTNGSKVVDKSLKNWLKKTTPKQRKTVVDIIYSLVGTTDALTTRDFAAAKLKNITTIMKSYKDLDDKDKEMVRTMLNKLFFAAKETVFDNDDDE